MDRKNRTRVLYSFPQWVGSPGVGTTAFHQIEGIVAAGCDVTVCCSWMARQPSGRFRTIQTLTFLGLPVRYRLIGNSRAFRFHDWVTARYLQTHPTSFDAVHCWPGGSLMTLSVARRLGIPSYLERPNTHTAYAVEVVSREIDKLGLRQHAGHSHTFDGQRLGRELAEFEIASYLLAPSPFVAETFHRRGFAPTRVLRHQYGYAPEAFQCPPAADPPAAPRPLKAAFVGRCEPRKGLHYALEAWTNSSAAGDGELAICGRFEADYRRKLQPLLSHPSIRVLGFVNDVPAIMRECDVLLLPSIEEGSALVTYEARACGCVLLVSRATGAVCRHGVDALVHEPGNVLELRNHIELLYSDRTMLGRLRACSIAGLDALTWRHAGEILASHYHEHAPTA